MTRVFVDEEELEKIYGVISELSEQLNNNRTIIDQLKGRSENVKGQATHVGTGFPLRRFNLDIADEEFSSELEKFASHLVLENQSLQHENKQLSGLLKEYESTLENVMSKFRGVAHASQQHDLSLHSYYTTLLSSLQTAHSSSKLHDDTSLSLLLSRLSTLLRTTLRSLGGEEVDGTLQEELSELVNGFESHPQIKSEQAEAGPGPSSSQKASTASTMTIGTGTGRTLTKPPRKPSPFPGSLPGSSGGYIGTEGHPDWAIEREMEIMRLEDENASLREMLSIANEIPIEEEASRPAIPDPEAPSPDASRKGSIAVEDLEADAAREAEEMAEEQARMKALNAELRHEPTSHMARATAEAAAATGEVEMLTDTPGDIAEDRITSPVGESKARASVTGKRPTINGSMLGFQAGIPPPEHVIADEPEQEESASEVQSVDVEEPKTT